jgi:Skp family chaperone for outer membrane proteins
MRDRILDEIKEVINSKAKAMNLELVVDTAAETINQTPMVLYSASPNDLTQAVLNELNSRGPLDLPAPGGNSSTGPATGPETPKP